MMNPRFMFCLLFAVLASALSAQSSWTVERTNLPGVSSAHSVAFGNGRFAVTLSGSGGLPPGVAWSTDGVTWRASATRMLTQGTVIFAAGAFYHAGYVGIWRSTDADTWQQIYFPTSSAYLRGMASNGRSIMVVAPNSDGKFVLYTPDLTTWRKAAPLPHSEAPGVQVIYRDLVYALGRYYLSYTLLGSAGGLPSFTPQVAWTVDGSEWTLANAPLTSVRHLAGGNGRLLALPTSATSVASTTDGASFTSSPISSAITNGGSMVFAGGRFFFAGSLQTSLEGQIWAPLSPVSLPANSQMVSMAYGNGRYVAVGYTSTADVIAMLPASAPPVIASTPPDRTVAEGARVTLPITLENPGPATTYQWRRNGVAIAGATTSKLEIAAVRMADAGIYTTEIRNALGMTVSEPLQLTVLPASAGGRIVNLSVLTSLDAASGDESTFTMGFVVGGAGTQGNTSLLVRAGGPALARFAVATPNADPRLELFSGAQKIAENDNWGGGSALTDVANRVGAFALGAADSKDAAVFSDAVARGDNSVKIFGVGGATGAVITEVYDATPASVYSAATPRLINVSVLKSIRSGATLSAGLVIGGATSRSVVIRVVGPSLAGFGVAAPLSDPRAAVFRGGVSAPFVTSDDWGGTAELTNAFNEVGAFALPVTSRDAALLLTLDPGEYVVQASNPGATSGTALIEIYELP
jgi:hypothetical protein